MRGDDLELCMLLAVCGGRGVPKGGLISVGATRYCLCRGDQVAKSQPVYVCNKEFGLACAVFKVVD